MSRVHQLLVQSLSSVISLFACLKITVKVILRNNGFVLCTNHMHRFLDHVWLVSPVAELDSGPL